MSSSIPLAIRLAGAAQAPQQEAEPQRTTSASSSVKPNAAGNAAVATAAGRAGGGGEDGRGNHQFWLGEIKIAENLYTIHRSAQDLVDFAAQLIGHFDEAAGNNQPIGIMSDGDIVFMTELTNDIVRGVSGITAVRHHGMRARKRKSRHHQESERNHHHGGGAGGASRGDGDHGHYHDHDDDRDPEQSVNSSKRVQLTPEAEQRSKDKDSKHNSNSKRACQRCGRTDTPEWRAGPEGRKTLCNVCGLLYAKQRGRSRKSTEAVASNVSFSCHAGRSAGDRP
ncbi:hypothetical protein DL769_001730 [Monosporascus sp. CRB-8-3]|nr:hypothetical protein DL769_001730 [Monosporascus sp. CRB-8-3]